MVVVVIESRFFNLCDAVLIYCIHLYLYLYYFIIIMLVKSYFLFFSAVVVSLLIIYYFYTIYYNNMNSKPVYAIAVFTDAIKGTVGFTEDLSNGRIKIDLNIS